MKILKRFDETFFLTFQNARFKICIFSKNGTARREEKEKVEVGKQNNLSFSIVRVRAQGFCVDFVIFDNFWFLTIFDF